MTKQINIQVDVVGQMRLFRTNVFEDKLAFIEELFQNAQRAGATKVSIDVDGDSFTIQDNGCGLENPEDLFTMARSGWNEDVKKGQQPFGEGFFSVVAVADKVTVESGGNCRCINHPPEEWVVVLTNAENASRLVWFWFIDKEER